MSSPSGGIAGPTYTDMDFRRMIAAIETANLGPSGGSYSQEAAKLRKYFGVVGQWWPEPGLSQYARAYGSPNDGNFRVNVENEIEENYAAISGGGTFLNPQDPGAAIPGPGSAHPTPGIGGTNPFSNKSPGSIDSGFTITSVTDFLKLLTEKNTWIRIGEFVIGGTLLIVGTNAVLRQTMGGQKAPQIGVPKGVKKAARFATPAKALPRKTARFKE